MSLLAHGGIKVALSSLDLEILSANAQFLGLSVVALRF